MSRACLKRMQENIETVIVGKGEVIELLLTALLACGHVLIDDVPGLGKTKMAKALSKSLGVEFKRVQFTPDLQPLDITGMFFYNQKTSEFQFRPGPIFTHILLADEINRAVPRTQSSLLEAMEEQQVTVEGHSYPLESPFMVIATENPIELEGTFPLPEAQLDRFLLRVSMGYPKVFEEVRILTRYKESDPLDTLVPVVDQETIQELRREVKLVKVAEPLLHYIALLAKASREWDQIHIGMSPRASLALLRASQAYAYTKGRDYVIPDDVKTLFPFVVTHRLVFSYHTLGTKQEKEQIIRELLDSVPVPLEDVARG